MNLEMKNYLFILPLAVFFVGCSNNSATVTSDYNDTVTVKAVANIMAKNSSGVSGTLTFYHS